MPVVSFFKAGKPLTITEISAASKAVYNGENHGAVFSSVSAIASAKSGDASFVAGSKQAAELEKLNGVLVFCTPAMASLVPEKCFPMECANPALAFNRLARALYPDALRSASFENCLQNGSGAFVHPTAKLEDGVTLSPGAVIGADVEIGRGSRIGPAATIAAHSTIGRNCDVAGHVTIQCTHIGDNVSIGPGSRIGHDGFGFVPGQNGLEKVPQLGRVIIQNNVEIGANSCIDRGSLNDTVIGEGTKIDNLVQIGHNVRIGRDCAIAALVGISGSVTIGNGVMMGGQSAVADHINIGDSAIILAASGVMTNVPSGARYGGAPAEPAKEWFRGLATLRKLSSRDNKSLK